MCTGMLRLNVFIVNVYLFKVTNNVYLSNTE